MKYYNILKLFLLTILVITACSEKNNDDTKSTQQTEFDEAISVVLSNWYPLVIDQEDGGYYSDITYDFKLGERHNKMIVTQSRHLWTSSKGIMLFPSDSLYKVAAAHGFYFLKNVMWDKEYGGFHSLVNKQGIPVLLSEGQEKTAYGNAFAIYGLATYYKATKNEEALSLAKETFQWLEEHSHDSIHNGYYQSLDIDGTPHIRPEDQNSTSDLGYKDQNSSIHLLEAFTTLYEVWPNELLSERLEELLLLIRDTITIDKGYMHLFFQPDWTPITFKNESLETIQKHFYLDHVSFGHDIETAYLLLEASHTLKLKNDTVTLNIAKRMTDHAILTGWDNQLGGLYDGGYYLQNEDSITILNEQKNWWSQAEALNTLLIMSRKFPNDSINYKGYFDELWNYTRKYMVDSSNGGWYEWGIDKNPDAKLALKGHIWKANYHNFRAITNISSMLKEEKNGDIYE
ncbi:cellobiose 2-epimerase [Marivirga lumbricoides]|uniref:Cellobiose 2-epimerase n=1 Tax=Marivirga lumbricoides TaxID=1046115 RepID=A0ABQ1M1U7_9BACT|nr:cellobiose 2-epimerase [Marivirga lumbricoides]